MTEAQLFEMLGRKQATMEMVQADYAKLVGLLLQIKMGKVAFERLAVNPDGTWALGPEVAVPSAEVPKKRTRKPKVIQLNKEPENVPA